ncbi:MAG TPA: hypothetical protein VKP60_15850, partial [Magnetospirillaceae bacterium]|nr:hypothetical protein [Magnetospirillaceae bacterium]
LIKETAKNPEGQKEFLDLLTQISNLERSRNRITHGLWNWNLSDPVTSKVNSTRAPHTFQESFDFHKLIKVAHKIGEITFKLLYPGGEDQVHEEQMAQMDQGPIFSRHFALTAVGVDLTSTHPFPENRPKPKKVRPTRQKSANQDQT